MKLLLPALVARVAGATAAAPKRPHVLFMLADDLGFADVSFHWKEPSLAQIPTPHLQKLAEEGTVLQNYYVQPVCSPTRATILSGRHVIHTGVYDPMNGGSGDLPLQFSLWPQFMKADFGYATHAVGKWYVGLAWLTPAQPPADSPTLTFACPNICRHLGYSSWRFTPVERGFDVSAAACPFFLGPARINLAWPCDCCRPTRAI
jgi:arylsulfatase A-like enzyme